ncbi:hypothetical protein V1511DRAFT_500923 [Dipodascopsis uninucleata]
MSSSPLIDPGAQGYIPNLEETGQKEPDTCRICRGEATEEEPLYHPCKCSGSIRYVHQDCLMEWLQHSQRKQICELCKTPFRFTKLYSTDMPSHIPPVLFVQKISVHIGSSLLLYLRLMLVCLVWLGWLPLSTRYVVKFYFWISDEIFEPSSANATITLSTDTLEQSNTTEQLAAVVTQLLGKPDIVNSTGHMWTTVSDFVANPVVSKILVDTFEGQVITGMVVLLFVVIFLIREWVLQNAAFNQEQELPMLLEQLRNPAPQGQALRDPLLVALVRNEEERRNRELQGQQDLPQDGEREIEGLNNIIGILNEANNEAFDENAIRRRNFEDGHLNGANDILDEREGGNDEAAPQRDLQPELHREFFDRQNVNVAEELPDENEVEDFNIPRDADPLDGPGGQRGAVADNGFWDTVGAWFRDNVLGDLAAEENVGNNLLARQGQGVNDIDIPRNAEEEIEEDADDFDGIMELIGMRGPLLVLFQNGLFSTVLVTGTLAVSLWVPYIFGKVLLLVISHPVTIFGVIPLHIISFWANQMVDIFVFIGIVPFLHFIRKLHDEYSRLQMLYEIIPSLREGLDEKLATETLERIINRFSLVQQFFTGNISMNVSSQPLFAESWNQFLHGGVVQTQVTGFDRALAVLSGYAFFIFLGSLYLSRTRQKVRQRGMTRAIEKIVIESLRQAGAILKVIVIIGIELVVFPLFCGILLDFSLLPLFANATMESRYQFTMEYPIPSSFIHWFVGTCYMFHFALFVSMCREIVRPGVLYFIRDPNDPNFHPIRDVLDRPVLTQLRKIGISALIYCSLICVCLGGVVYFVRYVVGGDLLPLNLSWRLVVTDLGQLPIIPYVIYDNLRFWKRTGLFKTWWSVFFRKTSAYLRLTSFMFNRYVPVEQGTFKYRGISNWFRIGPPKSYIVVRSIEEMNSTSGEVFFVKDGGFMRVPNSDSVHLRGGRHEFIDVSKDNRRLDGEPDTDENLRNTIAVYVPPHFRMRIIMLLAAIWIFATILGILFTLVPVYIGRKIFSFMQYTEPLHDTFCFVTGVLVIRVGFLIYAFTAEYHETVLNRARQVLMVMRSPLRNISTISHTCSSAVKLLYLIAVLLCITTIASFACELYFIIPGIHYKSKEDIHIVLFSEVVGRGVFCFMILVMVRLGREETILTQMQRRIFASGYFDPDARVITEDILARIGGVLLLTISLPLQLAWICEKILYRNASESTIVSLRIYIYPLTLLLGIVPIGLCYFYKYWMRWRTQVLDELYLVGEQLHNHNDH